MASIKAPAKASKGKGNSQKPKSQGEEKKAVNFPFIDYLVLALLAVALWLLGFIPVLSEILAVILFAYRWIIHLKGYVHDWVDMIFGGNLVIEVTPGGSEFWPGELVFITAVYVLFYIDEKKRNANQGEEESGSKATKALEATQKGGAYTLKRGKGSSKSGGPEVTARGEVLNRDTEEREGIKRPRRPKGRALEESLAEQDQAKEGEKKDNAISMDTILAREGITPDDKSPLAGGSPIAGGDSGNILNLKEKKKKPRKAA